MLRKLNFTLCDLVLWPPIATALAVWFYSTLDHWHTTGRMDDLRTLALFYMEGRL